MSNPGEKTRKTGPASRRPAKGARDRSPHPDTPSSLNICINAECKLRKAGCRGFEGCPGFKGRGTG